MAAPIAFESSWGKTAERQQLKEAREQVLAKAKRDYEKEERRREAALKRGEGTWMLPCVSDRIDQEQQELAKVKKKKSHKEKKHKKEKKAKKSKKHGHKRKDDDSSNSDSDDAAMWVEKPALATSGGSKAQQPCASSSVDVKGPKLERDSWMSAPLDLLPSVSRDDIRRKKMEKTEEEKAKQQQEEEMGRHKRELNPYWKEGGKGLPEEEKEEAGKKSVAAVTGDAGVGWLRRAYKRCEEMAAEEGRTLDEVAAERYGSLAKLKKMLSEAEKTLERLKEEERQERYGRREDDRCGRQRDHHGRSSDGGRRWEGRDRDRTPPRDRDRAKYGSRDKDSDRDRARGNRDLHGEDRPRRRFMKPGCDNDNGGQHSSRGREDHSPGRQRRGFLKPGEDTERQSSSREPRREKPSFKRPADDDDDDGIDAMFEQRRAELKTRSRSPHQPRKESALRERRRSSSGDSDSGSAQSESESSSEEEEQTSSPAASQPAHAPPKILTEEEMNRLGAKVLRAEMMGNETLAAELKQQLDEARKTKASTGACPQGGVAAREGEGAGTKEGEEVVLTRTDRSGMVRPLPAREYPDESHSGKRRKKPKVATHAKGGERERYFDDDDSYSLKALVEREKLGTAEDQNTMFARLAGRSVEATNDDYQVDDVFVSRAARHQSQSHVETRERQLAIIEHKQMAASLEKCSYCFEKVPKHLIISIGKKVYLCLPNYRSMTEGHCLIVPMMHATQATALDEDVWEEIQVFRKALTRMYTEEEDEDCVFMEICTRLKKSPHMVIECVPLPRELGDMAPIYFKKALLECDTEWTENKKVVDLSQKDVRRAVPKGFPYFAVDFGLQGGFAHVIEDETHFPHYFGREIVGGMLDLEPTMWRKHQKENFEDQRKKVLAFAEKWKPYDWTQRLDSA